MGLNYGKSVILARQASIFMLLTLCGCAGVERTLMPAPNLYTAPNAPPLFSDLPEELRTPQIDLMYVTDRLPEYSGAGSLDYGYKRSPSVAFGSAVVAMRPEMDWEELERLSIARNRSTRLTLKLVSIEERGRFAQTPAHIEVVDGEIRYESEYLEINQKAEEDFRRELLVRLAQAPRKEVVMFVHGFNNDFDDAAYTLAELWHYLGRQFVPILFTYPAGRGGPSGYIYDRESGEFAIYHLKSIIRVLSDIPELESFHLIAHSRGTDVTASAVRELALEARAARAELPDEMQNSHIVLAAPDLDMDVLAQRVIAEQLGRETRNITIYTSRSDKAIGLAEWFFRSNQRLGSLSASDLSEEELSQLALFEGISIVELSKKSRPGSSHGYFHSDPAASSDLILMLRYGKEPGAENGRPLQPIAQGFWEIEPEYPQFSNGQD